MDDTPATIVDAHLHLTDAPILGRLDRVLAEARAAGVAAFVTNGTSEADWAEVLRLARERPEVVPCFGLHPWFVGERSAGWLGILEERLRAVPSAVGEIGLDLWKNGLDERAQEEAFRAQLDLARRLGRPAMVHCVKAWDWLDRVMASEPRLPAGFLLHAFGGPVERIEPLAAAGAWFSFAGDTLEPRKTHKREALRAVPPDRLLIETDAPDMLPPPELRRAVLPGEGGRQANHPANLAGVLEGIAAVLGEDPAAIAERTTENARRLLGGLLPPFSPLR